MSRSTPQTIEEAIRKIFTFTNDQNIRLKRTYDDWYFKQYWQDWRRQRLIQSQRLNLYKHKELGSDLAVANFVIDYCRGQVRNENNRWIERIADLPKYPTNSFKLTGIYARKSILRTEGIDNFVALDNLELLDLSDNSSLDDFACDQLSRQFRNSKTLTTVNLSYNPAISVHGLNILFRIPSLRKLIAIDTGASKYDQIDLFVLAAEEEKKCDVLVHKDGKKYTLSDLEDLRLDKFEDIKSLMSPPQQIEAPKGHDQQLLRRQQ